MLLISVIIAGEDKPKEGENISLKMLWYALTTTYNGFYRKVLLCLSAVWFVGGSDFFILRGFTTRKKGMYLYVF